MYHYRTMSDFSGLVFGSWKDNNYDLQQHEFKFLINLHYGKMKDIVPHVYPWPIPIWMIK